MNQQRNKQKSEILAAIAQQRQALCDEKADFLNATAKIDAFCSTLSLFRPLVIGASGFLALWTLRRPGRLVNWIKRGMSVWSGWRVLRNLMPR